MAQVDARNRIHDFSSRTFASLAVRNYRLFFIGQAVSLSGTWMQSIAQGLLVLQLTGSGTALGVVTALQALPVLIFGPYGGVMADRYDKRRILYLTQAVSAIASLIMGALVVANVTELWMIYGLALVLGFAKVLENPTRQIFVREMVGSDRLTNAVSLNSMEMNLARVIGPTIAGVMVATIGLGACFIANGLSFGVVIAMLAKMDTNELHPLRRAARAKGQLVEGFRYVQSQPAIRNVLLMMAIIGMFTYEFNVMLPLLAEYTFESGGGGFAALTAMMGIGAVVGGLYTAGRRTRKPIILVISATLFGLSVLLVSIAPTMGWALAAMVLVGFFSINFTSLGNATLQLTTAPEMQGRVMSLWSVAFLGTTPIGGPLMGAIGEHAGARTAMALGGIAALIAAGIGLYNLRAAERAMAAKIDSGPLTPSTR